MKLNKRMIVAAVLAVMLVLVSTITVAAKTTRTWVTGELFFKGFSLDDPGYYVRYSKDYSVHVRHEIHYYFIDISDARLDMYTQGYYNANTQFDENWNIIWDDSRYIYTGYADEDMTIPTWDCQAIGGFEPDLSGTWQGLCHGLGEYEGLLVKATYNLAEEGFFFEGYIQE